MIYKILFSLISILIFLRPHFTFVHPILSVYMADIIIIGIILFSILIIKINIYPKHRKLLYISLIFIMSLLIPVTVNSFKSISISEVWMDYGKIIYFVMVFWYLYFLLINIPDRIHLLSKIIDNTFIIIFIISIIQLLDPPILGNLIKTIYGSSKLRNLWSGYPRVYGTFFNANWFGVYLVFYLSWLNSNFLYKKISLNKFIIRIILLIIFFIVSGSRTAMVGAVISMFFQFFNSNQKKNTILIISISILLIFALGYLSKQVSLLDKTLNRFISMYDIYKQEGLAMSKLNPGRWNYWMHAYTKFKLNPIFGSGYIGEFIPHNSYLYFLNMFGIVGAIIIIISFGALNYFSGNGVSHGNQYEILRKWKRGFIPAFLIMSLTAEFIFTTQVMLLITLIYAVALLYSEDKIMGCENI